MTSAIALGDVCEITMGQAPSGSSYNTNGEGLPLIAGAGDFGELYPAPKKYTTEASKVCERGDVVLGIRATIGEKVIADGRYCLGRGVAGLRPRSGLDARYLWHWLTHISPLLVSKARGATFLQVNKSDIGELPIALPSRPEQRRIVDILDKADALRTKRREALAHLDRLAQSIFLEMFGDPTRNPMGFGCKPLGSVVLTASGGTPDRGAKEYFGGGIPWVKSGELHQRRVSFTEESLTELGLRRSSATLMPAGTVLVAMYGATVGAISQLAIPASTNQAICCMRPSSEVVPEYLIFFLRNYTPTLLSRRVGGAQPNLSQELLRRIPLMLPPIEKQLDFQRRLEQVEQVMDRLGRSMKGLNGLFEALHQRAFVGTL